MTKNAYENYVEIVETASALLVYLNSILNSISMARTTPQIKAWAVISVMG